MRALASRAWISSVLGVVWPAVGSANAPAGPAPSAPPPAPAAISSATPNAVAWDAGPRLAHRSFVLGNGLRVLVIEDHRTPMVHEVLWVKVGSKDEEPRRTGFAHLFEHLMFKGSEHIPDGRLDEILEEAGGWSNAFTGTDMTVYQNVAAAPFLERMLWIEADRLAGLLGSFDRPKLDNQREVVLNERRESFENEPYGIAELVVPEKLWPPGHGYHWSTIGEPADLHAATVADVAAFFRRYYVPHNATMVIAGAVRFDEVKRLVEKYFAWIPRGAEPARPRYAPPPPITKPIDVTVTDDVQVARVHLAWRGPAAYSADEPALDLGLSILGGGKSSRLYRRLVYEAQLAQDVSASLDAAELGGTVRIDVTAKPGVEPARLAAAVAEEIAKLAAAAPQAAELERAAATHEADFLSELEPVLQRALALAEYDVLANDPDYFAKDLARYRAVTTQAVGRAIARYLTPQSRVSVTVAPHGVRVFRSPRSDGSAAPQPMEGVPLAAPSFAASGIADWTAMPKAAPEVPYRPPVPTRLSLRNGLRVLVVENRVLPIFAMTLVVPGAGAAYDPPGRSGLAGFTADMLDEGAGSRAALELAAEEERLGASVELFADYDAAGVTARGLAKSFDATLELVTASLTAPAFDEREIARVRGDRLTNLAQRPDRPREVAGLMLGGALYGAAQPYGRSIAGAAADVRAITGAELRAFFAARWQPRGATLVIVGDVDRATLAARLEATVGRWKASGPRPKLGFAAAPRAAPPRLLFAERADAEQTELRLGWVGLVRGDRKAPAFEVLRTALGGGFSSRLVQRLREELGITYGVSAFMDWRLRPGPFSIASAIASSETGRGVAEALAILRELSTTALPDRELEKAKQSLIRAMPAELESNLSTSIAFATLMQLGLPQTYLSTYSASVARVSAAEVRQVAKELLSTGRVVVSAVGDRSALDALAAALAPLGFTAPPRWHDAHGGELPQPSP